MSKRINPTDWHGYSVADDIKVTVSSIPIAGVRDTSSRQEDAPKPTGLWYACGGDWISWMSREMPHWLEEGKYLYDVSPKYSRVGLTNFKWGTYAGGVLALSSAEDVLRFGEIFGTGRWSVGWAEVAQIWDGIEICPYFWEIRNLMWYYGWDVASGCIWRPSGLSRPLTLLKGRESASGAVAPFDAEEHQRAHGRANPHRLPVRRNGLLG